MNCLKILLLGNPNLFHNWTPREWINLLLVCKQWRDYLYLDNQLAIDWGCDNDLPLRFACKNGFEERVSTLLLNPIVNPAALDNSPLMVACVGGHLNIVNQLLPITPLAPRIEILIASLVKGHTEVSLALLKSGRVDLSAQPILSGLDAQQRLAKQNNCSLALALAVQLGDNPELIVPLFVQTHNSSSLLFKKKCWKSIDCLLERINDLSVRELTDVFLSRLDCPIEADILQRWLNRLGKTAADSEWLNLMLTKLTNLEAIARLLENNSCNSLFLKSKQFSDQLANASASGHLPLLKVLTKPECVESITHILLHQCFLQSILHEQLECVAHYLSLRVIDPSYRNNQAICFAAEKGNISIVQLLLDNGAAAFARLNTPLKTACKCGNLELAQLFLDSSFRCFVDSSCLHSAIESNNIRMVEFILSHSQESLILSREMFREALENSEIMTLLSQNYPAHIVIQDVETLREIIEECLSKAQLEWLPTFVDSRLVLSEEIENYIVSKHYHQVNRERTELQKAALPIFKALLSSGVGRVSLSLRRAEKMIFTLTKYKEWLTLITAGLNVEDFLNSEILDRELFQAKIVLSFLKENPQFVSLRPFLSALKFTCSHSTIKRAQNEIEFWFALHQK